ncbi:galactokinase [Bacillus thuringiensis]|uniref:galactokinase n=1 Tax=Bacillus thuringiensis TaxID=1428 RepID=UPI00333681CB
MKIESLEVAFEKIFQEKAECIYFAPGRVNLIGEHTDYNGGHVFPVAITLGTYALARKRSDRIIRLISLNFEEMGVMEESLDDLEHISSDEWISYPKGMTKAFKEQGYKIQTGYDVLFYGNIPNGAGLSSSASIELVTAVMLQDLYGLKINRIEMIKMGQKVENEYIGVNSGIMDQFAIGMGKLGSGIWLDCKTLEYEYAPIELKDESIVIMNTNKRRELANSKYNERRSECAEAFKRLKQKINAHSLGEVTTKQFEENKYIIGDEVLEKRAKHVVYENERTIKALVKLKEGDLNAFGKLMNESHCSLEKDYEVTGKELDTLVHAAWEQPGIIGARMTGAGFGGCAIAIVKNEFIDAFVEKVGDIYRKICDREADFYIAHIGDGAREIKRR